MAVQVRTYRHKGSKQAKHSKGKSYPFASLLYTSPSFLRGFASVLDMGGTLNEFNYSLTPGQADYFALLADHRAIAADARSTLTRFWATQRSQG